MLTKAFIRYRVYQNNLKLSFIDINDQDLLNFSARLIALYQSSLTKEKIEEQTQFLCNGFKQAKIARGLNKLCLDRSMFEKKDKSQIRQTKLLHAAKILQNARLSSLEDFQQQTYYEELYHDLEQFSKIIDFKAINSKDLLNLYNVSLIQTALLYTATLEVKVQEKNTAKLRMFFRYLKFFRLLAKIRREDDYYYLSISGPLDILVQSQKYALQLASFFPALLNLSKWQLQSMVKIDDKEYKLAISSKLKIEATYHSFKAHMPEEITMFFDAFKKKDTEWKIYKNEHIFLDEKSYIIPDFSFQRDGKIFHIELFHKWHQYKLQERLQTENEVILAIDRSLLKNNKFNKELLAQKERQNKVLLYSHFPGATKVISFLNKLYKLK